MNENNDFALVPRPASAVEKVAPSAKRILSGMVADTLALAPSEDVEIIFQRGRDYYNGKSVSRDYAEAARCWRTAAEKGHARAQNNLGVCYENGHGVVQDKCAAVYWYQLAADQGADRAQFNLGDCYAKGWGVAQDDQIAFEFFQKAAGRGHVESLNRLGDCYEKGRGVIENLGEASKHYRQAAEKGDRDAKSYACLSVVKTMLRLHKAYVDGAGEIQDMEEAFQIARKLVLELNGPEKEKSIGYWLLGFFYGEGLGVPKDLAEAYKCFSLDAEQGDKNALAELKSLTLLMDPETIAEGQRRVQAVAEHRGEEKPLMPGEKA